MERKRIYRIQKMGNAYYICIPKVLVREGMFKQGVFIDVLDVSDKAITLCIKATGGENEYREHNKNSQKSGENTQKLGTASGVR
jgi:antitoxin component of MazEF toxin-antitoxin module